MYVYIPPATKNNANSGREVPDTVKDQKKQRNIPAAIPTPRMQKIIFFKSPGAVSLERNNQPYAHIEFLIIRIYVCMYVCMYVCISKC